MSNLFEKVYNPDILTCLSDLSNDEVMTPPIVANKMLDLLPKEIWSNPEIKILDPACKSGVFLREAAKRFIEGEKNIYPDLQERCNHIFKKQLYGISITELTSLLSRRSVYCSKYPNGPYSIVHFDNPSGNIRYVITKHTWDKNGVCKFCKATKGKFGSAQRKGLESHAYEFIHTEQPEEIWNMHFDVIISNPPYQLSDGGAQASAKPIYQLFVNQAEKLNPNYIVMIIPARWYSGGRGLDDFRDKMLSDKHLVEINDFPNTDDCFPGVNIRGGVCYFLWDKNHDNHNQIKVVTHSKDTIVENNRVLKYKDLNFFIRYQQSFSIIDKVLESKNFISMSNYVSSLRPFGLRGYFTRSSLFRSSKNGLDNPIVCYGKGMKIGYVLIDEVPQHKDWVNDWKVFTPRANNIGTELPDDNFNTFIGEPGTICTESYLVLGEGLNLNENSAINLSKYYHTKFVRFMHEITKSSQDATSKTHRLIPVQDFSVEWTDSMLYKKYNLNTEEINFIESTIKPMPEDNCKGE